MSDSPSSGVLEHLCALLSLSLAHFLWQGVLIAVAGAAAATALRHRSPSNRYKLYVLALLVMAICPIATMVVLSISHRHPGRAPTEPPIAVKLPTVAPPAVKFEPHPPADFVKVVPPPERIVASHVRPQPKYEADLIPAPAEPVPVIEPQTLSATLAAHSHAIVGIYLLGVALMLARTGTGLHTAASLRRGATLIQNPTLLELLERRARALGMAMVPPLAASARVATPCLIGVLKPMILIPTAVLNDLSVDQIGAIFAHELAHLQRHDHWISLAQQLIEAALFFHPCVWWISRRMSREREMCCDDLVIHAGNSRMTYAESLVRVAELCRATQMAGALAATGRPSELRRRLTRLIGSGEYREFVPQRNLLAGVVAPVLFALVLTIGFFDAAVSAQNSGPRIVFEDSFEAGPRGEWSKPLISIAPGDKRQYLGPFNTETVSLNLKSLPKHRSARLSFDMLVLRSWDGSDPGHGPDFFAITTGDGRVLHCTNFSAIGVDQAFPGYFGVNAAPAWTGAVSRDTLGITYKGEPKDGIYHIDIAIPHHDAGLTLRFMVGVDGDINDEAWGIDNVRVTVDDMVEPSAAELAEAWNKLGSSDASTAAQSVATLVAGEEKTLALVAPKLADAKVSSELVLYNVSRAQFNYIGSDEGPMYAMADASQRQTALAAHVLQLIGTDSAKTAFRKLLPQTPAAPVTALNLHERGTGQVVPLVPMLVRMSGARGFFVVPEENGHAELILPPLTPSVTLRGPRNVWLPLSKSFRFTPDATTPNKMDIELERGLTIGGKVLDEDGRPVEGAIVKFEFDESTPSGGLSYWDPHVMTNSEGQWSYALAPANNSPVQIGVFHPRFAISGSPSIPLVAYPSQTDLREGKAVHVLRAGVPVEGLVFGTDGKPIVGAWADWGNDRGTNSQAVPPQSTDSDGRFVYSAVPNTQVILTIRAKGYSPEQRQFRVGASPTEIRFDLRPGKPLTGRIVDPQRNPIAGARVYIATWRGMTLYDIPLSTDADGKFNWPEAPDDEVGGSVSKTGYNSRGSMSFRPGQDNLIELNPLAALKGTVVDDATGQPINSIRAIIGIANGAGSPVSWQRGSSLGSTKITANTFEMRLPNQYVYTIRVEADGYLPADSESFRMDVPERPIEFRLKKGASIQGSVLNIGGKPVAGADVILMQPRMGIQLTNGKLPQLGSSVVSVKSGADGGFSLPPQIDRFMILIVHDSGYARVSSDELVSSSNITLQPWASIEGTVRLNGKPAAGNQVGGSSLEVVTDPNQPRVSFMLDAKADEAGRFKFDRVPSGAVRIGRRVTIAENSFTFLNTVRVDALPGKIATAVIGGNGRAVIGKVAVPSEISRLPWVGQRGQIFVPVSAPQMKRPENFATMSPQERQDWSQKWLTSDEGKTYIKASQDATEARRPHNFQLAQDGSFRIEDVEAGTYEFHVLITAPPEPGKGFVPGSELATVNGMIDVPPNSNGSNEPLTVPPFTAQVLKTLMVGDVAPSFDVLALGDGRVKLADYRGKFILLNFWASWCNPCVVETPQYKQLNDVFSKDPRFVMINLSLDSRMQDAKRLVEKEQMKWVQGFLGEWSEDKVSAEYGVRAIPSLWLIGPDGKVIAKDLRGEAVKFAIEQALK